MGDIAFFLLPFLLEEKVYGLSDGITEEDKALMGTRRGQRKAVSGRCCLPPVRDLL